MAHVFTSFSWQRFLSLSAILFVLFLGVNACKSSSDPSPASSNKTAVSGTVVGNDNKPLAGVTVTSGTSSDVSDANGQFSLTNALVAEGRCIVKAEKDGYFTGFRAFQAVSSSSNTLVTLVAKGTATSITGSTGGTITHDGLKIVIPAAAVAQNGVAVTGAVQAYARYIAPNDPNVGNLMPGGDFTGKTTAGVAKQLVTYGAVQVELTAGGQPAQLAAGKTATVRFPAGTSTLATIPLWHFDDATATWIEEGTATLTGTEYVGTVSHFSYWNLDMGTDEAGVDGTLTGCTGRPLAWQKLRIGQQIVYTDNSGNFRAIIPAGQSFSLEAAYGAEYKFVATIPAQAGKTGNSLGTFTTCLPAVTGKLVGCNNAAGNGAIQLLDANGHVLAATDPFSDGTFFMSGAPGQQATIVITKLNGDVVRKTVTFPALGAQPIDIGSTDVCVSGTVPTGRLEMSFVLNGDGLTNEHFDLYSAPMFDTIPSAFKSLNRNLTAIIMARPVTQGAVTCLIQIPGSTVGTYNLDSTIANFDIVRNGAPTQYLTNDSTSFRIVITQYDPVGGRIKGTFSGTLGKFVGQTITKRSVTLTNGTFDLVRFGDR